MAVIDGAVGNGQIAAGPAVAAPVGILAGFDANGIVAHVKRRTGQEHMLAGFDIDPVAIGGIVRVPDGDVPDGNMAAPQRMQVPAGRVLEGTVLNQDPFAFPQGDQHRTEERLDFILVQRRIRIIQRAGRGPGLLISLVGEPGLAVLAQDTTPLQDGFPEVLGHLAAFYFTPGVPVAVDDAPAGNGDIVGTRGVDRRKAAAHVQAFKIRIDDGIQILIGRKNDDGILFHPQFRAAGQGDRAGQPDAGRHREDTASTLGQMRERV